MAKPTTEELRHVVNQAVMQRLEELAGDEHALRVLARDWFPDADEFDRRDIVKLLAGGVQGMRTLIGNRFDRLTGAGVIVEPGSEAALHLRATRRVERQAAGG